MIGCSLLYGANWMLRTQYGQHSQISLMRTKKLLSALILVMLVALLVGTNSKSWNRSMFLSLRTLGSSCNSSSDVSALLFCGLVIISGSIIGGWTG